MGVGSMALQSLMARDQPAAAVALDPLRPLSPRPPPRPARAKSVIFLFMAGGPSQLELFDDKPALRRLDGQPPPPSLLSGRRFAFLKGNETLLGSRRTFSQHGQCGMTLSDLLPHHQRITDDVCWLRGMSTDFFNHGPAKLFMNTGFQAPGRPALGAWATYGLGSESGNLPAFVVMSDPLDRGLPKGHASNWGSGFLPSIHQGTWLRPKGAPIDNLQQPTGVSSAAQRAQLDLLAQLNRHHLAHSPAETELSARIESFELAYRMQTTAPEAFDVAHEPQHVQNLYGLDQDHCRHFASQCVMARRMVERGVRFVQIYSGGMENQRSWDGHEDIAGNHRGFARETDQPIAGLLADLQQRGLLDETLVIWGGEFGRLPVSQKGSNPGRDHNPHAFTYWMAGAGIKGGIHHGATDELGHQAAVDKVSVNDLHATILHLLGFDHERLTYIHDGRKFRLTDVAGEVVQAILA